MWNKTYGSGRVYSIQETQDKGYIFSCKVSGNNSDIKLIKTDINGNIQWQKKYPYPTDDTGWTIQETSDNGFIIFCEINDYAHEPEALEYVRLIKTNSTGHMEWNKTFDNLSIIGKNVGQQTADGGYAFIPWQSEGILLKTDNYGNETWRKTFPTMSWQSLHQTTDGGFILGGSIDLDPDYQGIILKTDSSGNEQWHTIFYNFTNAYGRCVRQTTDGGFIFAAAKNIIIKTYYS